MTSSSRTGPASPMTARVRPTQILVVLALTNLVAYATRNALFAVYPDLTRALRHRRRRSSACLQTVFMIPHAVATLAVRLGR